MAHCRTTSALPSTAHRRSSTRQLAHRMPPLGLVDRWAGMWPLPVGERSMRAWYRRFLKSQIVAMLPQREQLGGLSPAWAEVFEVLCSPDPGAGDLFGQYQPEWLSADQRRRLLRSPLDALPPALVKGNAEAQAGMIVQRHAADGRVALYGLVTRAGDDGLVFGAPLTLVEQHADDMAVYDVARDLTKWYRGTMLGKHVTGAYRIEDLPDAVRATYRQTVEDALKLKKLGKSWGVISQNLTVDRKVLYRWRKLYAAGKL